MAVLPSLPYISVTVHNDDGELPEYPDAEPDAVECLESPSSVVVSNYIEAPSDVFAFECPEANFIVEDVCDPEDLTHGELWKGELTGYVETSGRAPVDRCFQFSRLKILPGDGEKDDLSEADRKKMENVGILQVRVSLGEPKFMGFEVVNQKIDISPATNTATEKTVAKKSLSLGMIYDENPIDPSDISYAPSYSYIHGWNNPLAIFQFKYRSRADLQKLLLIEKSPEPEQLPRENLLPTPAVTPEPSCSPPLALTPKEFEDLTFAEVRALARKQYISFDKLTGDDLEKLARQKYAEEMVHVKDEDILSSSPSVPHTPKPFEDLRFSEVRSLARKQYKSFKDLNGDEIEGLARQGYSEAMALSQSITSGATDERNGPGKRKVSIKVEDADEDVVFVSATKKKK